MLGPLSIVSPATAVTLVSFAPWSLEGSAGHSQRDSSLQEQSEACSGQQRPVSNVALAVLSSCMDLQAVVPPVVLLRTDADSV